MAARQSTNGTSNEGSGSNSPDTVTQAKQEREKQGTWEAEVSYGGEADLHRHLDGCDKNPGHLNFVPVDQFNVEHLPSDCQDYDLVDLVRVLSNLTVRVSVTSVSRFRPKTVPGSNRPYPCYTNKGSDMMRVGTGYVSGVEIYPAECSRNKEGETMKIRASYTNGMFLFPENETCKCKECLNSPTPKTQFAHIHINTAAHVVYDHLEGEHTTCHLFFDRGGTPDTCSGVFTLSGTSCVWRNEKTDFSHMTYYTHDLYLAHKLVNIIVCWDQLHRQFMNKYILLTSSVPDMDKGTSITDHYTGLTIIVSHPHGCSKQVSVGYCKNMGIQHNNKYKQFTYTTATCPGSSGAPVFLIKKFTLHIYILNHHIGNCEWNRELNYCAKVYSENYLDRGQKYRRSPYYGENVRELKHRRSPYYEANVRELKHRRSPD